MAYKTYIFQKKYSESEFFFCSDTYLHSLNKKFLQHESFTDVITFDYNSKKDDAILLDVYISTQRVRENALLYKQSFFRELLRVMVHGVLHGMGYGDKTQKEKEKMRILENQYIEKFYGE